MWLRSLSSFTTLSVLIMLGPMRIIELESEWSKGFYHVLRERR